MEQVSFKLYADTIGIEEGDELISINNIDVQGMPLDEISQLFLKTELPYKVELSKEVETEKFKSDEVKFPSPFYNQIITK